jgi:formylglycine-generating enzyme required for sulfatase activity
MTTGQPHLSVWVQAARDADLTLRLPGGVPMFFRRIPAGRFLLGSRGYHHDEEPTHQVVIPRNFYLGTFVVTQAQYRAVAIRCPTLKKNPAPSHFKGDRHPVEQVSWEDAVAFCDWFKTSKSLPPGIVEARLPAEVEWEYACRAGSRTEYYCGDGEAALSGVAWFDKNSEGRTHEVDERREAHPLGLHGLHGNVWEWCSDVWDDQAYRQRAAGWESRAWSEADAGIKKSLEIYRVLRGGSWFISAGICRSAYRFRFRPVVRNQCLGFRVCLVRGPADSQNRSGAEPVPGDAGRGTRPESVGTGGVLRKRRPTPRSGSKKINVP